MLKNCYVKFGYPRCTSFSRYRAEQLRQRQTNATENLTSANATDVGYYMYTYTYIYYTLLYGAPVMDSVS